MNVSGLEREIRREVVCRPLDGGPTRKWNSVTELEIRWKFVTVTECEFDVNVIAYEVLEGKAAAKLYAGRRMAAGI